MLQKGFTLIELMIVVAIIGILSMFALPAYQDYTKRTYVSEGFALASSAKLQVTEEFSTSGIWPATNSAAGMAPADAITGQSVSGIQVLRGTSFTGGASRINVGAGATLENGASATNIVIHYNARVTSDAADNAYVAATAAVGASNTIALAPVLFNSSDAQGSTRWVCQVQDPGKIQAKWLPTACRTESGATNK